MDTRPRSGERLACRMISSRRPRSFRRDEVSLSRRLLAAALRVPALASAALRTLNPCPVCGEAVSGDLVCPPCAAVVAHALAAAQPGGELLWLGPYAGPVLRMVHALKFGGQRTLAPYLGGLLAVQVRRAGWRVDVVTNVPASAPKLAARGFDQAELLARSLAAELGVPYAALIARSGLAGRRSSQLALGRDARTLNAAGAYTAAASVGAGHVLLVDDVTTSGATLDACRAALRTAGVRSVNAAVVARTVRNESDLSHHDDDGDQHA